MPPRRRSAAPKPDKQVDSLGHPADGRPNIPTAEAVEFMADADRHPVRLAVERRNRHLDPQLVWRGKDEQDAANAGQLLIDAPPLFIQEKVQPKAIVDDLLRESRARRQPQNGNGDATAVQPQFDLFADFNGLPDDPDAATQFYQHQMNWSNRMILGDSLPVMASLAEREGLRGQVQCIYIDPPYGIKFNSNFQWSTTSRDVKDGNRAHITREPEQVKAFRDTWRDGIHSYLAYLRDRLTAARDLLAESGSVFVQIGDENVHRVRMVLDEVFGDDNFVSQITIRKTTSEGSNLIGSTSDFVLWYGKNHEDTKFRPVFQQRSENAESRYSQENIDGRKYRLDNITSSRPAGDGDVTSFAWRNQEFNPGNGTFKTTYSGLERLALADRLYASSRGKLNYIRFQDDFGLAVIGNLWADISGAVQSRSDPKVYVVQTSHSLIERCILMTTDPGDLVLDPTCGAGTTAYVAEQWGRRWITIDTSRVALALARARLMGARYAWYLLADSREGQRQLAQLRGRELSEAPTYGDLRQGFVYRRVPHITLRDIANNPDIDAIYARHQERLEPLRAQLNAALGQSWPEWEIPPEAAAEWPEEAGRLHTEWQAARRARQQEIDASIAAGANHELLYDRPYEDRARVRVCGPFTVESLSPHRLLAADESGEFYGGEEAGIAAETGPGYRTGREPERRPDFAAMMLEQLRIHGVQQSDKAGRIEFSSFEGWPGDYICAEGRFMEGETERRAGVFLGPEFGTVGRPDLAAAGREAAESGFDVLLACAFSYDAYAGELKRLGRLPVLQARMNADLHMAGDLQGKGNLFVIFGEPDIELQPVPPDDPDYPAAADAVHPEPAAGPPELFRVRIHGVDIYQPSTGQTQSDDTDGIACWFVDTDYNGESFFVRQAYFLGASSDPYKALKTTLKAEIDAEAWESLRRDYSRPFPKPPSGRIAVKVINHLGDEALKALELR